jgi:hypothetical protein
MGSSSWVEALRYQVEIEVEFAPDESVEEAQVELARWGMVIKAYLSPSNPLLVRGELLMAGHTPEEAHARLQKCFPGRVVKSRWRRIREDEWDCEFPPKPLAPNVIPFSKVT